MQGFLVLLFAYTLSQFYRSFLAVIAGDLSRELGLDAAQLGSISAAWFVAFAVAQFPVGVALDRIGPRWTLAGLSLVAVVGAVSLASAGSFGACVAAMALIGIGCAPALMASMYVFARTYAFGRFATLSSTLIGLGTVGNLLGATPLALAVERLGWRPSMLLVAGLTAVSALLVAAFLRDPLPVRPERPHSSMLGGLRTVLTLRALWPLLPITAVSYAVVIATRALWIAPFLGSVHRLDVSDLGYAALAMGVAMSLGALAYGPIERTFGAKTTTLCGVTSCALAFLGLGLWGHEGLLLATAFLAAIGALGMSYAILMAHAREFIPPELLGRGVTFMNFVFIAGAGIVQWCSGLFVRWSEGEGVSPVLTYGRLHLAFGTLLLAAVAIYVFAPASRRHEDAPQAA